MGACGRDIMLSPLPIYRQFISNTLVHMTDENRKPVEKIRVGSAVATIWENDGANGSTFLSVELSNRYKDPEGNWKDGTNFKHGDLLNVAKAVERAEEFCATRG